MPVFIIEGPEGLRDDAKTTLMAEITAALDEAYHIPDVRIFLREHPTANVAQDGLVAAEPIRPVCFVEAPKLAKPGCEASFDRKAEQRHCKSLCRHRQH
jgi:phenylpyruvate tautomerase PptA (4-oxalocrotonate tautomerase family)